MVLEFYVYPPFGLSKSIKNAFFFLISSFSVLLQKIKYQPFSDFVYVIREKRFNATDIHLVAVQFSNNLICREVG